MIEFELPIFTKVYDLYKSVYRFRNFIPKQDRHTVWQKCEVSLLESLEYIWLAGHVSKKEKLPILERANLKLNMFRVFVRLSKDVRAIDSKKYVLLQENTDEVGRMLGGWIKSLRSN